MSDNTDVDGLTGTPGLELDVGLAEVSGLLEDSGADEAIGLADAPGVPALEVSAKVSSNVPPIYCWPTYVTTGVGVASGLSSGAGGIVRVHSPCRTASKPDGPPTTAIAPVSSVVEGDDEAIGLDEAPGRPGLDEPIGAVEVIG